VVRRTVADNSDEREHVLLESRFIGPVERASAVRCDLASRLHRVLVHRNAPLGVDDAITRSAMTPALCRAKSRRQRGNQAQPEYSPNPIHGLISAVTSGASSGKYR